MVVSDSGAEKVVALEACTDLAKRWATSCSESQAEESEKAKLMYGRYQSLHKRLLIEQILLQNNLEEKDLLDLSNKPSKLVFKLYEHCSIQERFKPRVMLYSLPGELCHWLMFGKALC